MQVPLSDENLGSLISRAGATKITRLVMAADECTGVGLIRPSSLSVTGCAINQLASAKPHSSSRVGGLWTVTQQDAEDGKGRAKAGLG